MQDMRTVYAMAPHQMDDWRNVCKAFAKKCGTVLLEERTFFPDALRLLGKRLNFMTRLSMKTAERKKLVIILRLRLSDV